MADPVIVPPPPAVTQPSTTDTSPGIDQLQAAFDQVYPMKGVEKKPLAPAAPTAPEVAKEPVVPPPEQPQKPPEQQPQTVEKPAQTVEQKLPSFLEEALKVEPSQPAAPAAPPEEEWPEELPTFKNSEEAKARYKTWRTKYNELKNEATTLRNRPAGDSEANRSRMEILENQNREMQTVLSRFGVEQSAEFQNNIIRPLYASWNEAAKLFHESGGDPQELAKAMTLSGKAQFESLDTLFSDIPESAKVEIHDALRTYRRFEDARKVAVSNAPKTYEGIRKREVERLYQENSKQREGMREMFDNAVKTLRDQAKVEVLQHTSEPEAQWWNEQAERMVKQGRDLYLENTDLSKVAMACLMAPMADAYRNLWIRSQQQLGKLQKIVKGRFGNEPTLSESGGQGDILPADQQLESDLKRPFSEVFLREFERSKARTGTR